MLVLQGIPPEWVAKILFAAGALGGFASGYFCAEYVFGSVGSAVGAAAGGVIGVSVGGIGFVPGAAVGGYIGTLTGIVVGHCSGWGVAELTGLTKIIKARKRVEKLKKKKANVDK